LQLLVGVAAPGCFLRRISMLPQSAFRSSYPKVAESAFDPSLPFRAHGGRLNADVRHAWLSPNHWARRSSDRPVSELVQSALRLAHPAEGQSTQFQHRNCAETVSIGETIFCMAWPILHGLFFAFWLAKILDSPEYFAHPENIRRAMPSGIFAF
jgi:hypothetical protein